MEKKMDKTKGKVAGLILAGLLILAVVLTAVAISCAGSGNVGGSGFAAEYDVVIIGAGGAGLSAAIAAREEGAKVAVFEKMAYIGGNTLRSTGGINAAGTRFQAGAGIHDDTELFYKDTMAGGYNKSDPALVRTMAEKSAASLEWLTQMGADLSDVERLAGASVNRAHRPSGGAKVGPAVVAALDNETEGVLGIPIFKQTRVTAILTNNGRVVGVEVIPVDGRTYSIRAKAVVLAAGGFGANNEMAASLAPSLRGFATTNHAGAMGDGILLAETAGAALVDMAEIQTHPTYAPGRGMITESVRINGAILVNRQGRRFVNELSNRDILSAAILAQPGKTAFLVFDDSVRRSLAIIEDYVRLKTVVERDSPEALAAAIGADPAALTSSIAGYNQAVAENKDETFGRTDLARPLTEAPYYAIGVLPAIHHTMGGVKIDTEARVISTSGVPIPGFYAAGEVTGGIHGGNRLGGNALTDSVTYGRIAGQSAARRR
jgi:fumarate reductase flavoprotein subunit